MDSILVFLQKSFSGCLNLFTSLVDGLSGAFDFLLPVFAIYFSTRLLKPVFGGGLGSDKAKKKNSGKDDS